MTQNKSGFGGRIDSPKSVLLRGVEESDLTIFFEQQLDPEANHMAAFTSKDPADSNAFAEKWIKILGDDTINIKTIVYKGKVAGNIMSHRWFGKPEVSYWIGKEYWGRGVATSALLTFLDQLQVRPLYARVAKDNIASLRVLEKCGFTITGYEKSFANARGKEIEEAILEIR
jgi:RimJ/RimL family protein N-acetyltransferase